MRELCTFIGGPLHGREILIGKNVDTVRALSPESKSKPFTPGEHVTYFWSAMLSGAKSVPVFVIRGMPVDVAVAAFEDLQRAKR